MKKIFSVLAVVAIAFFTANCGGGSGGGNNPASIEKSIYTQMQKGNFEKAVEIMLENLDSDKIPSAEEKAQFLTTFTKKAKQSFDAKGGIKSFEILGEEISEDGLKATVTSKIVFGNGEEETNKSKYVKVDGKWKFSMGK